MLNLYNPKFTCYKAKIKNVGCKGHVDDENMLTSLVDALSCQPNCSHLLSDHRLAHNRTPSSFSRLYTAIVLLVADVQCSVVRGLTYTI